MKTFVNNKKIILSKKGLLTLQHTGGCVIGKSIKQSCLSASPFAAGIQNCGVKIAPKATIGPASGGNTIEYGSGFSTLNHNLSKLNFSKNKTKNVRLRIE